MVFFGIKKKNKSNDETFINKETLNKLIKEASDTNATSDNNTEFNEYLNNAITELTSTVENNNQQGGGKNLSTSESNNSESESTEKEQHSNNHLGDYESSSAHSNGIDTQGSSTISKNSDKYLSDSINTSDINMISVE